MTAINIVRTKDRVILATDAASYDGDDGTVLAFTSKSIAVPHWPGAVATRGESLALPLLAFVLGNEFELFDALRDGIEQSAEDIFTRVSEHLDGLAEMIDSVACGWSEQRARPEAFYLRLGSADVLGMSDSEVTAALAAGAIPPSPYKLHVLDTPRTFGPDVSKAQRILAGVDGDTDDMSEGELLDYLRGIMEIQRRDLFDPGNGETPFSIVGGHCVATTVGADEVRQRVFHRWPDTIGERIVPGAPPEVPKLSKLRQDMLARRMAKERRRG